MYKTFHLYIKDHLCSWRHLYREFRLMNDDGLGVCLYSDEPWTIKCSRIIAYTDRVFYTLELMLSQ